MKPTNPFSNFAFGDLMQSVLPDFVLGFAFFTALAYAVLGKRFGQQRPAVAMSGAIGLALAIGLVWWEQQAGMSIRNLGPVAVGFAIIILAGVMYQAVRQVGGAWAGAGIALGASVLIGEVLGLDWPAKRDLLQTVVMVALVGGIVAFLLHRHGGGVTAPRMGYPRQRRLRPEPKVNHDMRDIARGGQEGHVLSDLLGRRLGGIRREVPTVADHPELAVNVVEQIRRTLPAEGWLTERMARLRAKAHRVRHGHIARIEETREVFKELPPSVRKAASAKLMEGYAQLAGIDRRLERLDRAVTAGEKRIKELTEQAEGYAARHDFRRLADALNAAAKLQKHNSELFKLIDRTEANLTAVANKVANETREVTDE